MLAALLATLSTLALDFIASVLEQQMNSEFGGISSGNNSVVAQSNDLRCSCLETLKESTGVLVSP